MKPVMPSFEFAHGTITCLHIPHGLCFQDIEIEEQIAKLASSHGKTFVISKPAGWESAKSLPLNLTSEDWLSDATNISKDAAKKIIAGIGENLSERVSEKLAWNAGTPRCLLGLVASLIRNPEILAYSTAGLDPLGTRAIHKFVATRCKNISVIHISYPSVYGDGSPHPRICPSNAKCIELTQS